MSNKFVRADIPYYVYTVKRQTKDPLDYKVSLVKTSNVPARVDLRTDNDIIFNQSNLGSCSANAGVSYLMKIIDDTNKILSRLFLYYQERVLEGTVNQDSGVTMRSICKALNKVGVCPEEEWPYLIEKFALEPPKSTLISAAKYKIGSYSALTDLASIKAYIAQNKQPVLMGMDVYESFESASVARTGIVPFPDIKTEEYRGGHAVLIVGYDDTIKVEYNCSNIVSKVIKKLSSSNSKGALIVQNSWGDKWGDRGYFYLPYEFITKKLAFDFWTMSLKPVAA